MTHKALAATPIGTALAAAAIIVASVCTVAADGPAVSDFNAKFSTFGGAAGVSGNNDGLGGVAASFTAPVTHAFGVQLDAAYARIGDNNFGNAGAHVFWRDPTVGLLGVYTGFAVLDAKGGVTIGRSGLEAQYYANLFTIDTAGGFEYGDVHKGYGRARLQLYLNDDVMLRGGWIYEGRNLGTAGAEYQFANTQRAGYSLFVDGNVGADSTYSVLGGLKVTFGESMSLKDRHRRQDPDSYAPLDLQATTQAAAGRKPEEACPFAPVQNLCGLVSLPPKTYAKIGVMVKSPVSLASIPIAGRLKQCNDAGYSAGKPGPAACGCAAAYSTCFVPG